MIQSLQKHVPTEALAYCYDVAQQFPFRFKLAGDRKSKAGDYRFDPRHNTHTITVNQTLNPYAFLITYIHEVAHLVAYLEFGRRIPPHGKEWKQTFKKMMAPLLRPDVFPDALLKVLARHMINPKASTHADARLVKALLSLEKTDLLLLDDIKEGHQFNFRGKKYVKLETRRTRVVCSRLPGSKRYLISRMAEVTI